MELTIKLDLRKSGETDKGFPIVVYISKDYDNRKWRTGHYTKIAQWNERLAAPKPKHPEYYVLLDYLTDMKLRISGILSDQKKRNQSFKDIKDALFRKSYDRFYASAIAHFPQDYEGTDLSAVRAFNKLFPNLLFTEITHDTAKRFVMQLLQKGNKPGGVDSYVRSLKAVWNRLTNEPNPFKGISIEIPEQLKTVASEADLKKLVVADLGKKAAIGGYANYRNYWLLMFYLGGIDPEVLAKLRYDLHIVSNRAVFNRDKGRSKTLCSNIVPKEAWGILNEYDCAPYLVPIFKSANYDSFRRNFSRRMQLLSEKLKLSVRLKPKSARYTFADRAQNLLIDERICSQILGHKRRTTTSIYTNNFPQSVQDESHKKVIDIGLNGIL